MTKGTCCSSVALIRGTRNETSSHRKASPVYPPPRAFHTTGELCFLTGRGLSLGLVTREISSHMKELLLKPLQSLRHVQWQSTTGPQSVPFLLPSHWGTTTWPGPKVKEAAGLDVAGCLVLFSWVSLPSHPISAALIE